MYAVGIHFLKTSLWGNSNKHPKQLFWCSNNALLLVWLYGSLFIELLQAGMSQPRNELFNGEIDFENN